ncbi:MAG TPA: L,D-transpeptidase family protein [Croceibacterium sp.]|nr:L,D-transpeptidase family protein [Croceibacterium sp.]
MAIFADERLLRFVLPALAAALVAPLPQPAFAVEAASHDATGAAAMPSQLGREIASHASKDLRAFYAARGNAPLWLDESGWSSSAATLLWLRMRTADRDGLNPAQFDLDNLAKLTDRARDGDPGDVARAEVALSSAFAAYVKAMRSAQHADMLYEAPQLGPTVQSTLATLEAAAKAPSLETYVDTMGWMNPLYAPLRKALDDPQYTPDQKQVIAANLARVRAIPAIPQGKHILVDAASARLWMYDGDRVVDTMKVVVGNEKLGETPMMAGWIRWAIENPYWQVPNDITQKELAPNVLKYGAGYLAKHGYQVLADWSDDSPVLDAKAVDWQAVRDGVARVHVRQLPGGENFMGKVKFEFPNPKGIYLHDTPAKKLMKEDARQLSHGCIRMEDAARMHRWLMGEPIPADAPAEEKVPLDKPVPIYVTYLTALPADSGDIVFHDDPYGRDGHMRLATAA